MIVDKESRHGPDGDLVLLDHGAGGLASQQLVDRLFLTRLSNPMLDRLEDSADLGLLSGRVVFSTDSFVVDPIFFPGGDIGELAVNGTVNDLAMKGGRPVALSLALIIEEGFPMSDLERIADSIAEASRAAGVPVVTGDTKVVPRGKADGIFINTSGVAVAPDALDLGAERLEPSDLVLVSGTVGDHGAAIMTARADLGLGTGISSDTMALHKMAMALAEGLGDALKVMRDPTRGGLATTLVEIAEASGLGIVVEEEAIPVRQEVQEVCQLLGLDPLYLANEGKLVAFVAQDAAEKALEIMRRQGGAVSGLGPSVIGRVVDVQAVPVVLETAVGGRRVVDRLTGEPLPRIC